MAVGNLLSPAQTALPLREPGVTSLAGRGPSSEADTLRTAARQFEAIFVKTMLDSAFKDGFGGMGDSGQAGQINSMWTRQLADSVTQGEGLGLQKSLIASLGAQTATAGPNHGRALSAYQEQAAAKGGIPLTSRTFTPAPAIAAVANPAHSQPSARFDSPEEFVSALRPGVEAAARELGVSPRILMAQAALETGWGQHLPADSGADSFNLFGIKADASWQGDSVQAQTTEFENGQPDSCLANFRRYTDYSESVRDYVRFIQDQPRYADALNHGGSDQRYIQALSEAGYATDPHYAARVLQVADSSRLSAMSAKESANDPAI